jgi:hypothetical protein
MNKKIFSEKTQHRMDTLKALLRHTEESIARLHQCAEGQFTLKGKGYTRGAEQYERTPRDEQRLIWTLSNLRTQIRFYQHELDVLEEYGECVWEVIKKKVV